MLPLEGVRVTDFTNHAAGPYCTMLLGLLGAEVIRIESRERLDIQRRPHPVYGRFDVPNFDYLAGGKRSVTLNLKTEQGTALAKELVAVSNVVVENFRPGVMKRLGLDWASVEQINPTAVMVSISAYGQTGPESTRPGYAPVFAAEGGLGFLTGYADGSPSEIRNLMDHQTGMTAALAAVSMLQDMEESGKGSYADIAAREVATMLVGETVIKSLVEGFSGRIGNGHEVWFPHGVYAVAGEDRWIALAVRSDLEWRALVNAMGTPSWCTLDLNTADGRRARAAEIEDRIAQWFRFQLAEDVVQELQHHGLCVELCMSAQDILNDPHLRQRDVITSLEHPVYGRRITVGAPWRFQDASVKYDAWSPDLGQHNEEVFCGLLGHSQADFEIWVEKGIIN